MRKLLPLLGLLLVYLTLLSGPVSAQLSVPTITATAKGPNQINLTWAAVTNPGYGYDMWIQSSGDSRYSSYTEIIPIPNASGDASLLNSDPSCTYCWQPQNNLIPPWVTEAQYIDPQDGTAAQYISWGLKNNTTYNYKVRTCTGISASICSAFSTPSSATTANYTLRYINVATGSDSNGGTNSTSDAWLTIHHGCITVTAGQVLIVMPGNYPNDTCNPGHAGASASSKIVITSNPGSASPVFTTASYGPPLIDITTNYVVVDSLSNLVNYGLPNARMTGDHGAWFGGDWSGQNSGAIYVEGSYNLIQGAYIHDIGTNFGTESSNDSIAIINLAAGSCSHNVVQLSHITRGSHSTGITIAYTGGVNDCTNNQWMNNILDGGWGHGLTDVSYPNSGTVTGTLWEGNIAANMGWDATYNDRGDKDGMDAESSINGTVRRNLILNGHTHGAQITDLGGGYAHATGNLYYNNTVWTARGYCYYASSGTTDNSLWVDNICTKTGTVADSNNCNIVGVMLWYFSVNTTWNVSYNDFLYYNSGTPSPSANIVAYPNPGTCVIEPMTYADVNFSPPFSNNASLSVVPQYVNEGTDFHLLPTSPLIGVGTSVTDSNWGTIAQTDLGAFKFFALPPGALPAAPTKLGVLLMAGNSKMSGAAK